MASTDFRQRFFRLSIVNILSNLLVPIAGLVDTAFLGHLAEIQHLAGVALATVLFNYIYWTFGFLRMGTTGTTAQAMGRGDRHTVIMIALRHGLIAVSLGLLTIALQVPLRELGFTLLSATSEVKASGEAYYNALIWGAPATLLNFVLIGWFLGREQGGKVFWMSIVGNGANVLLAYFFISQLGWASAGAGAATAISQYLMLIVGLGMVSWDLRFQAEWRVEAKQLIQQKRKAIVQQVFEPTALKSIFGLNGDILIRTFALVSTFALFTNLSSSLGTVVLATNTVLLQVITLAAYFIDGLAFATESFAGMFHGQNANDRLTSLLRLSGSISLSLGVTFATIFVLFPNLFGLLTDHTNVLTQIRQYVIWLFPVLGFGSIAYMLDGYFLGLTKGRILRQSTVIAATVSCIPMVMAAFYWQNSQALWLALTLFMATRAITLGIRVPETLQRPS